MPGSDKRRRLLFLGADRGGASWRFRVAQYLPSLRQLGFDADTAELPRSLVQRLRMLSAAARYDTVWIHRTLLSPFEHRWLVHAAPRYFFDFDDAIMLRDSAARRFDSWQRRRGFRRMVRGAAVVTAGNAYLAEWAQRYHANVTVIPTAVDLTAYPLTPADGDEAVVGWMGTASNLMYLRGIVPALARLCARRPQVKVKVVCDADFAAASLPVISKRWSLGDEVADLRSFQVGIMPLPDDPWTRGKCAVKILQYFAAGVPVVCAPVGVNREVVDHGRNGFFATTEDEWVARLDELLSDADLRRRFGAHGRSVVEDRYSVQTVMPRLRGLLVS